MYDSERKELGEFLKTRRARITPVDAGIIPIGRRRTKGLKREEVAQIAGISLTWYTWIEQGRDINFSVEVLGSIARALQLSSHEKRYIFELCGFQFQSTSDSNTVMGSLIQLVDHQNPYPAYLLGRYWQVLYMNSSAAKLFDGFDSLPPERQNIIWYTFVVAAAKSLVHHWEQRARRLIAEFRADCRPYLDDPWLTNFVAELRQTSHYFDNWWDQHDVQFREDVEKRFNHPTMGLLTFTQHTFKVETVSNLKLIVHIPA